MFCTRCTCNFQAWNYWTSKWKKKKFIYFDVRILIKRINFASRLKHVRSIVQFSRCFLPLSFPGPTCFFLAKRRWTSSRIKVGSESCAELYHECHRTSTSHMPALILLFSLSKADIAETIFSTVEIFRYHTYRGINVRRLRRIFGEIIYF